MDIQGEITKLEIERLAALDKHRQLIPLLADMALRYGTNTVRLRPDSREWKVGSGIAIYANRSIENFDPRLNRLVGYIALRIMVGQLIVVNVKLWDDGSPWHDNDRFIMGEWFNTLSPHIERYQAELESADNAKLSQRLEELREMMLWGKAV